MSERGVGEDAEPGKSEEGSHLEGCTPRTDDLYDLFSLGHLDIFKEDIVMISYDLALVAGWEPYNLHDLI